ncbi:hypothetical protein VTI74DRAFT_6377 [Chaetomium olivicolor]
MMNKAVPSAICFLFRAPGRRLGFLRLKIQAKCSTSLSFVPDYGAGVSPDKALHPTWRASSSPGLGNISTNLRLRTEVFAPCHGTSSEPVGLPIAGRHVCTARCVCDSHTLPFTLPNQGGNEPGRIAIEPRRRQNSRLTPMAVCATVCGATPANPGPPCSVAR